MTDTAHFTVTNTTEMEQQGGIRWSWCCSLVTPRPQRRGTRPHPFWWQMGVGVGVTPTRHASLHLCTVQGICTRLLQKVASGPLTSFSAM